MLNVVWVCMNKSRKVVASKHTHLFVCFVFADIGRIINKNVGSKKIKLINVNIFNRNMFL